MLKSKTTADILTQTDSSYRQYGTCCTSITEMKIVESFDKQSILLLLPFYFTTMD